MIRSEKRSNEESIIQLHPKYMRDLCPDGEVINEGSTSFYGFGFCPDVPQNDRKINVISKGEYIRNSLLIDFMAKLPIRVALSSITIEKLKERLVSSGDIGKFVELFAFFKWAEERNAKTVKDIFQKMEINELVQTIKQYFPNIIAKKE